jgi:tetratricopeptide (TPR) repeat protein
MTPRRPALLFALPASLWLAFTSPLPADSPTLSEKSTRSLAALEKRPAPGALFDRFIEGWLESSDLPALEAFLVSRADASPAAPPSILLGLFLARKGDDDAALAAFRRATEKDAASSAAWSARAAAETRLRDYDAAIASLTKARQLPAPRADSLRSGQSLGRLLARSGRTDDALATWNELATANPDDDGLIEDIMELQIDEGLLDAASTSANRLLTLRKDPYQQLLVRLRLGDILARNDQRDKALETWLACLHDTGVSSWLEKEVLSQIDRIFRKASDLASLRQLLERELASSPLRPAVHRAAAAIMAETGDRSAAIATLRRLIDLTPGDRAVREETADLLRAADQPAEALAIMEALLTQYPDDQELRIRLASLRDKAGNRPAALQLLDDFFTRAGKSEAAAQRRAAVLEQFGLFSEAAASLTEAAAALPPDSPLNATRASLLARSGKPDDALAIWRAIAASGNPSVLLQTARSVASAISDSAALDLLIANVARSNHDPLILTKICDLAAAAARPADALPFTDPLLASASRPAEIAQAIETSLRVIRLAKADSALRDRFAASDATLTPAQRGLFARLLEAAGEPDAAARQLASLPPESGGPQRVQLFILRGDWAAAAALQQELIAIPAMRQAENARILSDLWIRAGNTANATAAARLWQQLAPDSPRPILALANILASSQQESAALDLLRHATARFPDNEEIRARLAASASASGRHLEAIASFRSLYDSARDSDARSRWLQLWIDTAESANRIPDLIEEFSERRRAAANPVDALLALAELHRRSGDYERRRAALADASRAAHDHPDTALAIAALHEREDNRAAAIAALRPALDKDPSGLVRERLARLLLNSKEPDEGLRLIAASAAAATPEGLENLALGLFRADRPADALKLLDSRPDLRAADYRLRFLSALLLLASQQPEAAGDLFLDLLQCSNDLPDARTRKLTSLSAVAPSSEDEANAQLCALFPGHGAAIFKTISTRSAINSGDSNTVNPTYPLPSSLDDLHDAALGGLAAALAAAPDSSHLDSWLRRTAAAGFPWMSLIPALPDADPFSQNDSATPWKSIIAKHPDSLDLLAVVAAADAISWDNTADPELATLAWDAFHKSHPLFALTIALPSIARAEEPPPWESTALTELTALQNPQGLLVYTLLNSLQADPASLPDSRLPARDALEDVLLAWLPRIKPDSGLLRDLKPMVASALAASAVRRKDAARLAAVITHEFNHPLPLTYSTPGSAADTLEFPPPELPGVSSIILELFIDGLSDPFSNDDFFLDPDLLAEAGSLTKSPLLRALMTMSLEDDLERGTAMDALAASAGTDPASLVLLASWFLETNDIPRAADFLIRASASNLPREFRSLVDSSLAQLGADPDFPAPIITAARDAALRLRRDARSPAQRHTLAEILQSLGLAKEALALDPLLGPPSSAISSRRTRPAPPFPGNSNNMKLATRGPVNPSDPSQPPAFSPTRIDKLIAAGQTPDAVNLLVSSALADATSLSADPASAPKFWNGLPDPVLAWLQSVNDHSLTAEVSAAIAASDSNPLARGTILTWLQQDALAIPLLEEALSSSPPSTVESAHAKRFLTAIRQLDAPTATTHLLAITDPHRLNAWAQAFSFSNWKGFDRKRYAAVCHDTLRRIIPSLPPDSSEWIAAAAFVAVDMDPDSRSSVARDLYPLICRFPKAAPRAITYFLSRHQDSPAAILADAAVAATIATAPLPAPPARQGDPYWPLWPLDLASDCYPSSSYQWPAIAATAIRESWRANQAASLESSLAARIASSGRAAAARRLIALYTSNPDNFSVACRDFLAAAPHPASWSIVSVAASDRQIFPDLSSRLDTILATPIDKPSYQLRITAAAATASITAATKGPEAATAFLDSLATRFLGPPESRASRLASVRWERATMDYPDPRPAEAAPLLFVAILIHCTENSAAAITPALTALHKHVVPLVPKAILAQALQNWSADFEAINNAVSTGKPDKIAATIRRAGILSDVSLAAFSGSGHPIDSLRALLIGQSSELSTATLAELSRDPDSLAHRLLIAVLSRNDSATTNTLATVAAARPDSAAAWARLFTRWSLAPDAAALSPEAKAFIASASEIDTADLNAAATTALTRLRSLKTQGEIAAPQASSFIHDALSSAVLAGQSKVDEILPVCLRAATLFDAPILDNALDEALTTPRDPAQRTLMLGCVTRAASTPNLRFPHRPDPDAVAAFLTTTSSNPVSPWLWNGSFPGAESLTSRGDRLALLPGALQLTINPEDRPRFQSWFTGSDPWESVLSDRSIALRCRLHAALSLTESPFASPAIRTLTAQLALDFPSDFREDPALASGIARTAALHPLPPDLARRLLRHITPALLDSGNGEDANLSSLFQIALQCNELGRASAILRHVSDEGAASCAAFATIARNAALLNTALTDWSFARPLAALPTHSAALDPDSLEWLATAIPDPARRWHLSAHWAAADPSNPAATALLINLASRWPEAALTAPSDRLFALSLLAAWPPALALVPDAALPKSLAPPAGSSPDEKAFAANLLDRTIRIARGDLSLIDLPTESLDRLHSVDDQRVPRRFLAAVLFHFPNLPADRRTAILAQWSTVSSAPPEAIALMRALNPDDPGTPLSSAPRDESTLALWPFPLPDNFDRDAFASRLHKILAHRADRDTITEWITRQLAANPPKP